MSTVDCPKCGHTVSDEAETCPSCGVRLTEHATQLELELTRIDLEWERERHKYMAQAGRLGAMKVPLKTYAVVCGLLTPAIGIVMGIVVVAIAGEPAIPAGLAAAGTALLLGVVSGRILYLRADRYEQAEAEYHRKREAAKSKFGSEP